MSKQWQLRRGTTAENNGFTGAQGELTMDTDTNALRIHDGVTQGGHIIDCVVVWQAPTAENNYTWYRKYASGWVEQGGFWVGNTSSPQNGTIGLPITMANTNYQVLFAYNQNADSTSDWTSNTSIRPLSATQLKVRKLTSIAGNISWEVKGMAA